MRRAPWTGARAVDCSPGCPASRDEGRRTARTSAVRAPTPSSWRTRAGGLRSTWTLLGVGRTAPPGLVHHDITIRFRSGSLGLDVLAGHRRLDGALQRLRVVEEIRRPRAEVEPLILDLRPDEVDDGRAVA